MRREANLKEMEDTQLSYWSEISTPRDVTIIYGMTEDNLNAYVNASSSIQHISAYGIIGYSRLMTFMIVFAMITGAAALLLPLLEKT